MSDIDKNPVIEQKVIEQKDYALNKLCIAVRNLERYNDQILSGSVRFLSRIDCGEVRIPYYTLSRIFRMTMNRDIGGAPDGTWTSNGVPDYITEGDIVRPALYDLNVLLVDAMKDMVIKEVSQSHGVMDLVVLVRDGISFRAMANNDFCYREECCCAGLALIDR